ncbi:MAG: Tenacibaculum phage PTm1 [Bacteroidota bacterium]|jgi:hypothetical protein
MKGTQSKSKNPLSIFKNKLSYDDYIKYVRQLVSNFNYDADTNEFEKMYQRYLDNYVQIEKKQASRICLSMIGFFSATQLNINYWIDRGWSKAQAIEKIKKRQSTCTPEIAAKIQATLSKKTKEEKAEINKRKGNGLNADWLVKNQGLTQEEAKQKIFNRCSRAGKIKNTLYKKLGKAVSDRQLSFYLERGLTLEDAKNALKERQTTTSLQAYVKKYGYDEGIKRYEKRIDLFKKNWANKPDDEKLEIICKRIKRNKFFSTESYIFFKEIEKNYFINLNCLYGKNEYFLYDNVNKKIYFYDFVIPEKKIIIEYHGSFWHADSNKSKENWKNPIYTYEESLQKDKEKKRIAEEAGFLYFVVWDYQRNNQETIKNLLNINLK